MAKVHKGLVPADHPRRRKALEIVQLPAEPLVLGAWPQIDMALRYWAKTIPTKWKALQKKCVDCSLILATYRDKAAAIESPTEKMAARYLYGTSVIWFDKRRGNEPRNLQTMCISDHNFFHGVELQPHCFLCCLDSGTCCAMLPYVQENRGRITML